jgi:hypothetical protein
VIGFIGVSYVKRMISGHERVLFQLKGGIGKEPG